MWDGRDTRTFNVFVVRRSREVFVSTGKANKGHSYWDVKITATKLPFRYPLENLGIPFQDWPFIHWKWVRSGRPHIVTADCNVHCCPWSNSWGPAIFRQKDSRGTVNLPRACRVYYYDDPRRAQAFSEVGGTKFEQWSADGTSSDIQIYFGPFWNWTGLFVLVRGWPSLNLALYLWSKNKVTVKRMAPQRVPASRELSPTEIC